MLTLEPKVRVTLGAAFDGAEVRYTLDGTDPTPRSARYERPFDVTTTFDGVRVSARAYAPDGRASPSRSALFRRTNYRESESIASSTFALGLRRAVHDAALRTTVGVDTLRPARHLQRRFSADRSVRFQRRMTYTQQAFFDLVRVSNDAAEILGTAGYLREAVTNQATGAAFRCR